MEILTIVGRLAMDLALWALVVVLCLWVLGVFLGLNAYLLQLLLARALPEAGVAARRTGDSMLVFALVWPALVVSPRLRRKRHRVLDGV